jgi:hypothetical protein
MPAPNTDTHRTKRRLRKILPAMVCGSLLAGGALVALDTGTAQAACSVTSSLRQTGSGTQSQSVECLQTALNARGFNSGPVDGWFGPVTAAAVRSFQAANGLTVDGWVGRATRSALGITANFSAGGQQTARRVARTATRTARTTASRTFATGASGVNWDAVARCESGGQWGHGVATNRFGSFSGGLMIMNSAWRQFGGTQFANIAGNASKAQQIVVAERIAARVGAARAWSCPTPHR